MKISQANILLTNKDIFNILKEFVNVEGLRFSDIEINELITVLGSYTKGMKINFEVKIGVGSVCNNVLNLKIFSAKVAKLSIFEVVKNATLKGFLKYFEDYGINVDKDTIQIDLSILSKTIPYVYFKLNSINIVKDSLELDVENIIYTKEKEGIAFERKKNFKKKFMNNGCYGKIRNKIEEKIPYKCEKISKYALLIPDVVVLLYRIFRDERVDFKTKAQVAAITAYLASPLDIIPDFIPFIGNIDDVAIAFYGLNKIINEVPKEVILENWEGEEDIILKVKEVVDYISQVVGSSNVSKLISYVEKMGKKA
ncbi:hypothetical protein CLOACE_21920 [Clostridium acetireducens DSM 10703]|uniref:DUF1232 domain-containing protein n=1 Tax=Clostridium acetireducens DSM 10703 TaxID=1121290 RepID=A0A1E8EVK0_9CLOT|nr:YkvA family protein [Clostridium acetireducens]OFI00001.1 hypothetical protein CLOACE_21920 [Clostridium acetireducens DSM 10703]